jgi:hypothetical protein
MEERLMGINLTSVLVGFAAALALPSLTRVLRPLAVEVLAAGMGALEEARRLVAEQVEILEDIAAEAKAKREVAIQDLEDEAEAGEEVVTMASRARARRRSAGNRRTAASRSEASDSE